MRKILLTILSLLSALSITAKVYKGRVVDDNGHGVGYATVYPQADPVTGTATNNDGYFRLECDLPEYEDVIISYIGYEKVITQLGLLDGTPIVLHEQPIALEETVVAAKASRQRNKKKAIAALLHQVYNKMQEDFTTQPARYHVVSDVRMDSEEEAWGMEQMIATIVNIPEAGRQGRDSIQFHGNYCKRYFRPDLRQRADTILAGSTLENLGKMNKSKNNRMDFRQAVNAVDSGVAVHRELWRMGNVKYDLEQTVDELRKWSVTNESEGETVLTYIDKHNFLGIFKIDFRRNYILDSQTMSIRRFSEQAEIWINIPFGYKLNADQLTLLNMLNMGENDIEKFRLRKMHAIIKMNTIYQRKRGHIYTLEKNLKTDTEIIGSKKAEIPIQVRVTQRVTLLDTDNVQPMKRSEMTQRLQRQIVEIY